MVSIYPDWVFSLFFQVRRKYPVWKQRRGKGQCGFDIVSVCFCEGNEGGLNSSDSFMPLWQRLYVLSDGLP